MSVWSFHFLAGVNFIDFVVGGVKYYSSSSSLSSSIQSFTSFSSEILMIGGVAEGALLWGP